MTANLDRLADLIANNALPLEPGESMQISVDPWFGRWNVTIKQQTGTAGGSATLHIELPYLEEEETR